MGDIFDDVLGMENADLDATTEATTEATAEVTDPGAEEANFNEAELEDIMAEIENLEKDFAIDTQSTAEIPVEAKAEEFTDEQIEVETEAVMEAEEIDDEMNMMADELMTDEELTALAAKTPVITEVTHVKVISPDPKPGMNKKYTHHVSAVEAAEVVHEEEIQTTTKVLNFEKKTPVHTADPASNVTLSASGDMTLNLTFKIGNDDATLVIDKEKGLLVNYSGVNLTLHPENGCTLKMENGVSLTVPVQSTAQSSKKAM